MKARTAAKVARLKKLPNKGRYGAHHWSRLAHPPEEAWTEPIPAKDGRKLVVALLFMVPGVMLLAFVLIAAFGGN